MSEIHAFRGLELEENQMRHDSKLTDPGNSSVEVSG